MDKIKVPPSEDIFPNKMKVTALGREGWFWYRVHPWEGSVVPIQFRDDVFGNAGWVRFDAKTDFFEILTDKPYYEPLAEIQKRNDYFLMLFVRSGFLNFFRFGWSPDPDKLLNYDTEYHDENLYTKGLKIEQDIKSVQAKIIQNLANPQKILIAGCSNGELVRQCQAIGVQAWGFDVISNIKTIAFAEVRDRLRFGSITKVPYDASDAFDTFVAIDVLEHIPERDLDVMIAEWVRLKIKKLVLLINLNECEFPGHITLRPMDWWLQRFSSQFRHVKTVKNFPELPNLYSNDGLYNHQWIYCERV